MTILSIGAVAGEDNQRVLGQTLLFQPIEDAPDLEVDEASGGTLELRPQAASPRIGDQWLDTKGLPAIQQPERDVPDYLTGDYKGLKGTFARVPKLADGPYPVQMEPNLVVEYYSL